MNTSGKNEIAVYRAQYFQVAAVLVLLIASVICGWVVENAIPFPKVDIGHEEFEIYRLVLDEYYDDRGVYYINENTAVCCDRWKYDFLKDNKLQIQLGLMENFRERNKQANSVRAIFENQGAEYQIVNSSVWKRPDGSSKTLTLTKVGFDPDMVTALVYVDENPKCFSVWGYFLLSKGTGRWVIKDAYYMTEYCDIFRPPMPTPSP